MAEFSLTEAQAEAVYLSQKERFFIITGGAGVGKTSTIKEIVLLLVSQGENVVLASPTGKAAARITEATGHKASTLHSACGIIPSDDGSISRSQGVPAASYATVLIIDEASMLDDFLLSAALTTISQQCRVILVGDPNQLPPVGAGYPFRDLIQSGKVPVVALTVCHRQEGKLLDNCHAILRGNPSQLIYDAGKGARASEDWAFIHCQDESLVLSIQHIFTKGNDLGAVGIPCEELLVTTPLNRGSYGRIELNRHIQNVYHSSRGRTPPTYNDFKTGFDRFVVGDRVIWKKNKRDLGLVNGDVGTVTFVGDKEITVDFDGIGEIKVPNGPNLWLAWVLTTHSTQGSQYKKALVIVAEKHCNPYLDKIVNRSLIYTAATRSKKGTYFIGSERAFRRHVETPAVDTRQTYLRKLLS